MPNWRATWKPVTASNSFPATGNQSPNKYRPDRPGSGFEFSTQASRPITNFTRLTSEDRLDLVAYLDGELEEENASRIEKTIAGNEVARREVDRLDRVYELLDALPKPPVSAEFTQSTMAAVLEETADEKSPNPLETFWTQWQPVAVVALVAAAASFLATLLAASAFNGRAERRLRLVPVAERLETFQEVGDVDFLKGLASRPTDLDRLRPDGQDVRPSEGETP